MQMFAPSCYRRVVKKRRFDTLSRLVGLAAEFLRGTRLVHLLATTLVFAGFASSSAWAKYLLDSGDVLEISVFGRSELTRRVTVDVEGNILVPLVGEVRAAGMTLTDLRAKVNDLLSTSNAVRGSDVTVELMEPRPFYIYGHVIKAGAYPYRPGMTVRQALALAGGLGTAQAANISPLTTAEVRGRYMALKGEIVKQQVRVAGLRAELTGKTEIDLSALTGATTTRPEAAEPLRRKGIAELRELEVQRLKARRSDRERDQQYLGTALNLADDQISALEQGQKQDEQAAKEQIEELERIADLSRRGLTSTGRVSDEQRAAVLLKSREMDTKARLALARQAREELQRKLEKADDREIRIPQELQNALNDLEAARSQLNAISEQLVLSNGISEPLDENGEAKAPEVTIYRSHDGASVKIAADEDTKIEPSDVVEIKVGFEALRAISVN